MTVMFTDIGAYIVPAYSVISTTADSEVAGAYVDREAYNMPLSGSLLIFYSAALGEAETLTVAATVEADADGSGAGTDLTETYAATVVDTGDSGGETVTGVVRLDLNLAGAKRYIRPMITLTTSSTGTVSFCGAFVFGGTPEIPA